MAFGRKTTFILARGMMPESCLVLAALLLFSVALYGQNEVLGEIEFVGTAKVDRMSGVWVDGQYVGYLKELKGSKRILLLPGEHEIVVRHSGHRDFITRVIVEPGQKHVLHVALEKNLAAQYPDANAAKVRVSVRPNRAAVFVDDVFAGHVDEFDGPGQAMLVAPGKHRIKIILPGYRPFETEVVLLPRQEFALKTDLLKGSITQLGSPAKKQ